jgi:hypothetical protein
MELPPLPNTPSWRCNELQYFCTNVVFISESVAYVRLISEECSDKLMKVTFYYPDSQTSYSQV